MIHPLLFAALKVDDESDFPKMMKPESLLRDEGPAQRLTALVLKKFPDLFPNIEQLMQGPTEYCFGQVVTAETHMLQAQYSIDMVPDPKIGENLEDMIYDLISNEIGADLSKRKDELAVEGKIMCPYQLVIPVRVMNDSTFAPAIKFKTRYGVYDPKAT